MNSEMVYSLMRFQQLFFSKVEVIYLDQARVLILVIVRAPLSRRNPCLDNQQEEQCHPAQLVSDTIEYRIR